MSQSVVNAPEKNPRPASAETSANGRAVRTPEIETQTKKGGPIRRFVSLALGSIGPTLVLIGFAAVFYYGHHNDWRIPKFAALTGSVETVADDWCEEHAVPESNCVECDPTLMPKGPDYGWCEVHGVHNCVLDHPDVAQIKETPSILPSDLERAARALAVAPRKENNSACKIYQTRIQFASIESVKQAGVDVELIERAPIVEAITGSGEIVYDPTKQASLASRVPGSVWLVTKGVGDLVTKGEVLAVVDAAQVGDLKTNLLRALAEENLQRQNVSRLNQARSAIAGSRILDAEAALSKAQADVLSAEQSLRNLGLPIETESLRGLSERQVLDNLRLLGIPDEILAQLNSKTITSNLIPIVSPIEGFVTQRHVAPGEVVDPTRILFEVANTSQMWLTLNVPLENMDQLAVGQPIRFQADGSRYEVEGKLNWISTAADSQTRMVQVRAMLPNVDGKLRSETFGTGQIILREESDAIVIPNGSSHWEGCCQVVFVRDKHYFDSPDSFKVFHVRSVRLGATNGEFTEVISGVLPGEVIAAAGSDVLRAQLLKNNLGAGCDCVAE
ncbi:Cobalt-zinc-cadmium resistance protein CzcB [Rubripirellula lacrimiformis]|uniref:Cobalt-zinc-cadmium resistance protein CzcB n=1 Tax=Rubripirellula lacrimiformis TaxID=1930273 RepID=A0A517NDA8_9BACT|nr:efflux RND transporter periplasmic adaptor subunit [Rubripirellula lacrimiformis]QDT05125.1 Cobalt-zinc-cadmium resistance protein CzcB [Rubripirellula lacrimiformis]